MDFTMEKVPKADIDFRKHWGLLCSCVANVGFSYSILPVPAPNTVNNTIRNLGAMLEVGPDGQLNHNREIEVARLDPLVLGLML
jgi:hypothetical protein